MRNIIVLLLTNFCSWLPGQNFIATYTFSNVTNSSGVVDPGPAPVVENLTMGNFRASNSSANPGASGRFSFSGWPVGAMNGVDDHTTYTAVLSPFVFYEVGMKVAASHTLDLKSISFYVRRSGTGIRNYCVRTSLDNYAENLAASTGTNVNLEVLPEEVFFWKYDSISTSSDQRGNELKLGAPFSELTDTVAFRFFAWNSEATGGTFSIDNVTFSGYVKDSTFYSGLKDVERSSDVVIYPNPVEKIVHVTCERAIDDLWVEDLKGTKVLSIRPQARQADLDVTFLPNGLYFLRLSSGGKPITQKLVVLPH